MIIIKKKAVLGLISILIVLLFLHNFSDSQTDILDKLEGKIYYTKRDGLILNLYTNNADYSNERLIYSHEGKGIGRYGNNDNIIDFYYDEEKDLIYFIAMKDGNWSLFSIKEGNTTPIFLKHIEKDQFKTDYIKLQYADFKIIEDNGSLYIIQNGKEKLLKKFHGIYDSKYTGNTPIGLSPDGKYLIYYSNGHLTPLGSIVGHVIKDLFNSSDGNLYIMELETRKSNKYPYVHEMQWIID